MSLQPFHLAFPVHDLAAARDFYVGLLGCGVGRSSDAWIDLDLYGHQIVAHLDPSAGGARTSIGLCQDRQATILGCLALRESERAVVDTVTAQIVNKLLHLPTIRMKEAAVTPDGLVYADVVRHLFGLVEEDEA